MSVYRIRLGPGVVLAITARSKADAHRIATDVRRGAFMTESDEEAELHTARVMRAIRAKAGFSCGRGA